MKTTYEELVEVEKIGIVSQKNINDILTLAKQEELIPAEKDEVKTLFLGIDFQNDFMENGALGVPGSLGDVERVTKFIYNNLNKITKIAVSLDTHKPLQIFHAKWWQDDLGNHPEPYTIIQAEEVKNGKWNPLFEKESSLQYVQKLEEAGKKQLCIWPYHCIEGTFGCSLEGQFANLIYFHSLVRKTDVKTIVKGQQPATEMYGIFRPEVSGAELENNGLLEEICSFDQIIIAGEAKSHCVLESVLQLLEHKPAELNPKIYILEDCTSNIPGFEEETDRKFAELHKENGIQIVKSDELIL